MARPVSWVRRLLVVSCVLLPLVLGSSLEESAAEGGFGPFDPTEGSPPERGNGFPGSQQQQSVSAPEATTAHLERIVNPTLGPFNPSPEIKFPEPHHPAMPPAYGEAKIPQPSSLYDETDSGLRDVLSPPHPYHSGPATGYEYDHPTFGEHIHASPMRHQQHHQQLHHRPRPLLHPDFFGHGGAKGEDFHFSYDAPDESEEQHASYQYFPPGPHFPQPPNQHHPAPVAAPHDGPDTDLLGKKAGKTRAWKTLVAALTTLVPIGLFLAALPPNYVTVTNSSSLRAGKSDEGEEEGEMEYPVLGLMGRYGLAALGDPECESRVFCEMSRMGKDEDGNAVQRVLWRVVNDVPDVLTEMVGLRTLFKAARTDSCQAFKCKDTRGTDD